MSSYLIKLNGRLLRVENVFQKCVIYYDYCRSWIAAGAGEIKRKGG